MTDELYFYEGAVVRVVDGDTVDSPLISLNRCAIR